MLHFFRAHVDIGVGGEKILGKTVNLVVRMVVGTTNGRCRGGSLLLRERGGDSSRDGGGDGV